MDVLYQFLFHLVKLSKLVASEVLENLEIAKLTDNDGWTLAHVAVVSHASIAIKSLKIPEIAKLENKHGRTVAHVAIISHCQVARKVLKSPDTFGKIMDNSGRSLLQLAADKISK